MQLLTETKKPIGLLRQLQELLLRLGLPMTAVGPLVIKN